MFSRMQTHIIERAGTGVRLPVPALTTTTIWIGDRAMAADDLIPHTGPGKDLTGLRFGRLVVIGKTSERSPSGLKWLLRCDCGNEIRVTSCNLNAGYYQSCGCYRREFARKHGMTGTPEYQAWADMINRCLNPKNPRYKDYGGRGITVCDRWRSSFDAFYEAVGPRPAGHLLDRIDNEGCYEPGNVRWVPSKVSARNRRTNHLVEWRGEMLTVTEWAERFDMNPTTLFHRLRRGIRMEEATIKPAGRGRVKRKG